MKREIRGLKAGRYWSEDGTVVLRLVKSDKGVLIEIGDLDADIYYSVEIDENSKPKFEVGQITPSREKGDSDGADQAEL